MRLGAIATIIGGYAFPSESIKSEKGYRVIRISDFNDSKIVYNKVVRYNGDADLTHYEICERDILMAMTGGTVGKSVFLTELPEKHMLLNQRVAIIRNKYIFDEYLNLVITSPITIDVVNSRKNSTNDNISMVDIYNFLVPVPPTNEQKKIVQKIQEALPLVYTYGKSQEALDKLNAEIFDKLKKSVLQEAIQGKLVPQSPVDEPAFVLLERIKAEKAKLFKEGKLKKKDLVDSVIFKGDDNKYYEKIDSEVTCIDDEIPFEIPDRWTWARGKTIFMPMQSTKPTGESFTYIDVDAVNNRKNIIDNAKCVLTSTAPSRATRKVWHNSILFSMVRPYLKNIALVGKEYCNAIASTGFYVIRPSMHLYPEYIFQLMLSTYVVDGLNKFMKGDNSPSINNEHIEEFLYPIPPANEQQRIICKLYELLPIMK